MTMPLHEDPMAEAQWCQARRAEVQQHLTRLAITHGRISEQPAWHVAPYVSIWAIESEMDSGWVGWWAIAGDLPTDAISAQGVEDPRAAMAAFGQRWTEVSACMERGEAHPELSLGTPQDWPKLAPLLQTRASLLTRWAQEQSLWETA